MQMLKFKYDVILGQSYELVDMPYTTIDRSNNVQRHALSALISGITASKMSQFHR